MSTLLSTPRPGPTHAAPRTLPRRLLRAAVHVLAGVAALAVVATLVALVAVPRVMGWVPLTILSGSMEPAIPVGSQVVVDPVEDADDVARIEVGDVVTFMPWPDDPTLVTHRVVTRSVSSDGTVTVTTQGDANAKPDGLELGTRELRAVVRYHVPYGGHVARLLDQQQKTLASAVLAGGLVAFAAAQLALGARDRRRERSDAATGDQGGGVTAQEGPVR